MGSVIVEKLGNLVNSLFQTDDSPGAKLLNRVLLMILYIFGAVIWIRFLNFGSIPDDRLDWADITFPRLQVIQQAVQQGELPLYYSIKEIGLLDVTNLFLSIPDQIFSPDVFLLNTFTIQEFVVAHILIFYSFGFWALINLKKKFSLSFFGFIPLFLLFNFNGHIVSHLSVGHLTWASYFLLPFFFDLILDLFSNKKIDMRWVTKISFLLFLMFLSGGYHHFVWCLFFLSMSFLVSKDKKYVFYSMVFSVLINMVRILPAALLSNNLDIEFMVGFPTSTTLIEGFVGNYLPESSYFPVQNKVNVLVWEFNYYLGIIGIIFVIFFSINYFQKHWNEDIHRILFPVFSLLFLSIGNIYKPLFDSGLPFFSGERVSSRFLIMVILPLFIISVMRYQEILNKANSKYIKFGLVVGTFLLANDLIQHTNYWNVGEVINVFPPGLKAVQYSIVAGKNVIYESLLIIGLIITLLSTIFLTMLFVHKKHKPS